MKKNAAYLLGTNGRGGCEALLDSTPIPDFEAVHIDASASAVESTRQRVKPFFNLLPLHYIPPANTSVATWEREEVHLHLALREWISSSFRNLNQCLTVARTVRLCEGGN